MKRKLLIGIGLTLVVGLLVFANLRLLGEPASGDRAGSEAPKGAPAVKVAPATRRDLTQTVMAPGAVEAAGITEVRAPFTSPRITLLVGPGDSVTAGQVIAQLDADDYRLQVASQMAAVARAESSLAQLHRQRESSGGTARQRVEQTRASLLSIQNRVARSAEQVEAARVKYQTAEAEYRANPLSAAARQAHDEARAAYDEAQRRYNEESRQVAAELAQAQQAHQAAERDAALEAEVGGTSAEQIRTAEMELASARESLALMQRRLEEAVVKAPASGNVLAVAIRSGANVQQGQVLLEIGSLEQLKLKARVDELDIDKVRPGQPISVRSNAFLQERFEGTVERVAVQATVSGNGAGYFEVQGAVENPEGRLRAGMNVQAEVTTDSRSNTFVIGLQSVREQDEGAFVPVVVGHKVVLKPVRLGLRTQTEVEIIEGLEEGDQVIISPFTMIRSVTEGAPVRAEQAEPQNRGDQG